MNREQFNLLHKMIVEAKSSMSVDDFYDTVYKVSSAENPDGVFYNHDERLKYEQMLEQINDKHTNKN